MEKKIDIILCGAVLFFTFNALHRGAYVWGLAGFFLAMSIVAKVFENKARGILWFGAVFLMAGAIIASALGWMPW